jgi:hypothetical protein
MRKLNDSEARNMTEASLASPVRSKRRLAFVAGIAGLFVLAAGSVAMLGASAWGDAPDTKQGAKDAPARWVLLFRADDPALWNTTSKGENFAVPLKLAPATFRYLRLMRMDTREALIIRLNRDQLQNDKPPTPETGFWWNGTAKEDWKGRHLGIVEGPRYKFPDHRDVIAVMTVNWDAFTGSGFGHKCHANDGQYYCWRGKQIRRTAFEVAVSDGPLSADEKRYLLRR